LRERETHRNEAQVERAWRAIAPRTLAAHAAEQINAAQNPTTTTAADCIRESASRAEALLNPVIAIVAPATGLSMSQNSHLQDWRPSVGLSDIGQTMATKATLTTIATVAIPHKPKLNPAIK
jgi:hypothetical protein